jgi:hypothetical protein
MNFDLKNLFVVWRQVGYYATDGLFKHQKNFIVKG